MILRSPTEDENEDLRYAGMDCRHPGSQDDSGDIHVRLDSSTPCWNDAIEGFARTDRDASPRIFQGDAEHAEFGTSFNEKFNSAPWFALAEGAPAQMLGWKKFIVFFMSRRIAVVFGPCA